jgi:hypothetical protein
LRAVVRRDAERFAVGRRAVVRAAVDLRAVVRPAAVPRTVGARRVREADERTAGLRATDRLADFRAVVRRAVDFRAVDLRVVGALLTTVRTTLRATFLTVEATDFGRRTTGFRRFAAVDFARVLFAADVRDDVAFGELLAIDARVTFFEALAFVDRARDDFVAPLRAFDARFFGPVAAIRIPPNRATG